MADPATIEPILIGTKILASWVGGIVAAVFAMVVAAIGFFIARTIRTFDENQKETLKEISLLRERIHNLMNLIERIFGILENREKLRSGNSDGAYKGINRRKRDR